MSRKNERPGASRELRGAKDGTSCKPFLPAPIPAVKLALCLWTRDGIISMVALAGWPSWRWAHRAVDACEVAAEAMVLSPGKDKPVVIVESELDAILAAQEARDIVTAIAMRTARAKPDTEAHKLLLAAPVVLVATDADEAGATAFPWWREHYNQAVRWPVPGEAKDVGDCAATPGLVRAWIEAGIPEPMAGPKVEPVPVPEPSRPAVQSPLHRADALAHGEPCPYSDEQLAAFRVSHPQLVCCPATSGHPWNWRERSWCDTRCKTPCGRSEI